MACGCSKSKPINVKDYINFMKNMSINNNPKSSKKPKQKKQKKQKKVKKYKLDGLD